MSQKIQKTVRSNRRHFVQHHVGIPELRIWKHSHGRSSVSPEDRQKLRKRFVLTIYRDTGKKQGQNFRTAMQRGDYFYLCHGNDIQLFGQVTSGLEKPNAKWVERRYRPIWSCQAKNSTYKGPKKYWAPNANSTSKLVPRSEFKTFERLVLKPFFRLSLRELTDRLLDESIDEFLFDTLSVVDNKEYEEARSRLILHEAHRTPKK